MSKENHYFLIRKETNKTTEVSKEEYDDAVNSGRFSNSTTYLSSKQVEHVRCEDGVGID